MKNPNFLVLDEPTNDLDIQTLQILEEYLQDFPGCVIIVSHDRYFMDKVVDHLLVFNGKGDVKDFPGNYTQYRDYMRLKSKEQDVSKPIQQPKSTTKLNKSRNSSNELTHKMTFKEKYEYEQITKKIELLNTEKQAIEKALCSGTLSVEELTDKSKRLPLISSELDKLEMRWLELDELKS